MSRREGPQGFHQGQHPGRKGTVKDTDWCRRRGLAFEAVPRRDECRGGTASRWPPGPSRSANGDDMTVLLYVGLTVAVFALLGLVQKLVEQL